MTDIQAMHLLIAGLAALILLDWRAMTVTLYTTARKAYNRGVD